MQRRPPESRTMLAPTASAPDFAPDFAIEAEGLDKTYRAQGKSPAKHALKSVNLAIPRGSFFGLLGPNGAGKSTFINILAGLVIKSSGAARIWGHDIDADPMNARGAIGVVPQELSIDPFFTPREALEIQAGYYGLPKSERRTDAILDALGLADKKDAYARTLSGGMRRRLLVAKALVHAPPVLVLDEPTAGVDVDLRRQLWDYVRELHASGVTIVLTTHYLEEAQELCDTIAIINKGEVIACESTGDLVGRLDQKTLLVTPKLALDKPPGGFDDVSASIRPNGALAITYHARQCAVEHLLDRVRAAGVAIADLSIEEPDLEDVFVELTRNPA